MPRKQRMKIGWMFGAIGVAIVLLIIGRISSDQIDNNSNSRVETFQVDRDTLQQPDDSSMKIEL